MNDIKNKDTLLQYKQQLSAVEELLKTEVGDKREDLLNLKEKLSEVVSLLEADQVSNNESMTFSSKGSPKDEEYLKFQQEINELEDDATAGPSSETADNAYDELCNLLRSLEGNKCRAPFMTPWGQRGYHNGIIFATELPDECEDLKDVMVKVMFSNPICEKMKPCPFFLDGYCKFSDDKCRYSHGYAVKYADLEDYVLPDYSLLTRDSFCLARCEGSDLWQSAIIENCLSNHQYSVKITTSGHSFTLDGKNVLPLAGGSNFDDDDTSSSSSEESLSDFPANLNEANYVVEVGSSALGSWEKHTNGIGSKLMAKMGYVWGQGLGKNSDGRIEPIEAVVLPKGKSLDRCLELRENQGAETVEDRFNAEQVKEEQRVKKFKQETEVESSVFAFLNKNLSTNDHDMKKHTNLKKSFDEKTSGTPSKIENSDLNFEMYSVGEEIKKTRKVISRLQQSLKRNDERNQATHSIMKEKMTAQTNLLQQLINKEKNISNKINMKKGHKKITLF